jgi:hypothetical protein
MTRAAALLALALLSLPARTWALCAPAATAIFPVSAVAGSDLTATVTGEALGGATVTVVGDVGLAASVQSANDLGAQLHLTIDAGAAPGERILVLDTPGGSAAVSFTVIPPGGPEIASVSPSLAATLGLPLSLAVTGASLGGVSPSTIAVSGAGVTVSAATPSGDGTTLALDLAVAADADLGTHALTIGNGVASVVLTLYVSRPPPTVAALSPAAGNVGTTVPITLTGTSLTGAALVVTGTDVTVGDVIATDTSLTATLTIAPTASPAAEPRLLIVTTESGQTTIEFFIIAAGVPTVTAVLPGAGEPGATVAVVLRGLNLTGVTVTESSPDITLQNQTVVDDETITLEVVVAPGATINTDQNLSLTPGGVTPAIFRVIGVGQPFFNRVRPPFGNRGATVFVRLDGVNLSTVIPGTGIGVSGSGVATSNALALDDHTAQVTLVVDPNANIGASRNVSVTTTAGGFTKNAALRVNNPGQRPSITDVSPRLIDPGMASLLTVTGSKFDGGSALVTGPGATVADVAVDPSGAIMTFDLMLANDAPAESRAVIVVTPAGTARCNIASNPPPVPLTAAKLVKPGALFTVDATGFRLFVFEFSLNDLFAAGLRTAAIPSPTGALTLTRQQTVAIEQAFRDARRGVVRVRAVTATNRIAASTGQPIRR